ncbi:MAG: hypothetical protein ABMA02_14810 [Saprospiraceae bacterium]
MQNPINKFTSVQTGLAVLILWSLLACAPTFRSGFKKFAAGDQAAARPIFERYREHPKHGPAARFFLEKMRLAYTRDLPGLLEIERSLTGADSLYRRLPAKQAARLAVRYGVDTAAILDLREQAQRWAVAYTRTGGTLPTLDSLLKLLRRPLPAVQPDINSARTDIVNAHLHTTDYDTMTYILLRHLSYVLPENYEHTRRMSDNLWTAFLAKYTPCQLDRFTNDHWNSFVGRDCWKRPVRELLCAGKLPDMLDFHADNRWSALEIVLINAIADLAGDGAAVEGLNPEQSRRLQDLRERALLRSQLSNGTAARDTVGTLAKASAYISKHAPRYSAYRLLEESFQFFTDRELYHSAIALLEQARPFFPDTLPKGCNTNFDYQHRVRPWIDGKLPILRRPARTVTKQVLAKLNTPEGEEFSPVVRADGREVFFAGKNRPDNTIGVDVFASRWDDEKQDWGTPKLVPALTGPGNCLPLSITADGRLLLVSLNKRLHTCRRSDLEAEWSVPEPLPVSGIAIVGNGCFSADGNTLVLEGAYSAGSATQAPDLDLFVSLRDPTTGAWSSPTAMGADINTDGQETAPYLMPDGKTLFYVSTGYPGLGRGDVFSATRTRDSWTQWTYPDNLGKELNDTEPHLGFSTVSPDGKRAWGSVRGDICVWGF